MTLSSSLKKKGPRKLGRGGGEGNGTAGWGAGGLMEWWEWHVGGWHLEGMSSIPADVSGPRV